MVVGYDKTVTRYMHWYQGVIIQQSVNHNSKSLQQQISCLIKYNYYLLNQKDSTTGYVESKELNLVF